MSREIWVVERRESENEEWKPFEQFQDSLRAKECEETLWRRWQKRHYSFISFRVVRYVPDKDSE